jgi:hypothetical protein
MTPFAFAHELERFLAVRLGVADADARRARGDPDEALTVERKELFFDLHRAAREPVER